MGRLRSEGVARPPSLDDELQREAEQRAGDAIGDWLMGTNYNRPIAHLSRDELRFMAAAAISGWVLARAEQARSEGLLPSDNYLQGG